MRPAAALRSPLAAPGSWGPRLVTVGSWAILVGAGALKALAPAAPLMIGPWRLADPWPSLLAVAEIALALCLMMGWSQRWTWAVCRSFFAIALAIHAGALFGEDRPCGCFGSLAVPAAVVVPLLGLLLAGSILLRTPPDGGGRALRRLRLPLATATALLLLAAGAQAAYRLAAAARPAGIPMPAVAMPASGGAGMPGSPPPITTGDWLVCYYRGSCALCREELPGWIAFAREAHAHAPAVRWLFIDLDIPGGVPDPFSAPDAPFIEHRRLPEAYREAPDFLRIVDGVVRSRAGDPRLLVAYGADVAGAALPGH